MSLESILDTLGGDTSVAKALGCGVSAISNWKTRGIPPGRKFDLLALAEKKAVKLTIAEIEAANVAIKTPNSAMATEAYADAVHAQASEAV